MLRGDAKPESDYVSLPFPSAYVEKVLPVIISGEKYSGSDTYSREQITNLLLNNEKVKVDVPRTSFIFGAIPSTEEIFYDIAKEKLNDLNISKDQLDALMVFSDCLQNKHLQGGLFSLMGVVFLGWFNNFSGLPAMAGSSGRTNRIVRNKKSELCVLHTVFLYDPTSLEQDQRNKINENSAPIVLRYSFTMAEIGDGFQCVLDQQEILIKKDFWENKIISSAKEKLAKSQFSDKDIILFVPLLCDKNFAAAFVKKLQSEKDQEKINKVYEHVRLCFGIDVTTNIELTFWQKHRSKIIFTLLIGVAVGVGLFTMGAGTVPLAGGVLMGAVAGISIGELIDKSRRNDESYKNMVIQDKLTKLKSPPFLDLAQSWQTDYTPCVTVPSSSHTGPLKPVGGQRRGSTDSAENKKEERKTDTTPSNSRDPSPSAPERRSLTDSGSEEEKEQRDSSPSSPRSESGEGGSPHSGPSKTG